MILLYENVKNRPSEILSLTGLTKPEFGYLLPLFEKAEDEYVRETYINGKERERAPGGAAGRNFGLPRRGCSLSFFT